VSVVLVVCVILLIALGLGALLAIPLPLGSGAGVASAAVPSEPADARARLASMVPAPSAIVGALPAISGGASLQAVPAVEPPSADLSTIGCGEDKEEAAAAVWREVRGALAQRSGKSLPSGGR
jgi:hypothetical protein